MNYVKKRWKNQEKIFVKKVENIKKIFFVKSGKKIVCECWKKCERKVEKIQKIIF